MTPVIDDARSEAARTARLAISCIRGMCLSRVRSAMRASNACAGDALCLGERGGSGADPGASGDPADRMHTARTPSGP